MHPVSLHFGLLTEEGSCAGEYINETYDVSRLGGMNELRREPINEWYLIRSLVTVYYESNIVNIPIDLRSQWQPNPNPTHTPWWIICFTIMINLHANTLLRKVLLTRVSQRIMGYRHTVSSVWGWETMSPPFYSHAEKSINARAQLKWRSLTEASTDSA